MSKQDPNKPARKTGPAQIGGFVGIAVGLAVFQVVGPKMFPPPPGGGFNFTQMLVSGVVGAVCAVIGFGIGNLFERGK